MSETTTTKAKPLSPEARYLLAQLEFSPLPFTESVPGLSAEQRSMAEREVVGLGLAEYRGAPGLPTVLDLTERGWKATEPKTNGRA